MKDATKNRAIFQAEYQTLKNAAAVAQRSGQAGHSLQTPYEELLAEYHKLLDQSVRLVTISDTKQEYLFKLQSELQNILDNIGQGILTVDETLTVHRRYSAECETIFGCRIEGQRFTALIKQYNTPETIHLLESILNQDFFAGDKLRRSVMLLLLPTELTVGRRFFSVQYKPLTFEFKDRVENAFMIILADITEKKALEQKMAAEKTLCKAVTKIVADMQSFTACIRDYRSFITERLPRLLTVNDTPLALAMETIFREIHTLKGNFAIFEIPSLVDLLEQVEDFLAVCRRQTTPLTLDNLRQSLMAYPFETVLEESLQRLREIIGNQWRFDREYITIDLEEYKNTEQEIRNISPQLAAKLSRLRYQAVAHLLSTYPDYTVKLAERLGKKIAPFAIESRETVSVDPEKFAGFFRSLIHVFRNIADHGIESPEERSLAGKDPCGRIRCEVTRRESEFMIQISDDGRGIDYEAVRNTAVTNGIIDNNAASSLSPHDLAALIFCDGVSTAAASNGVSGRGVGLAAVKQELENLGGAIAVRSVPGQGTEFTFHFLSPE